MTVYIIMEHDDMGDGIRIMRTGPDEIESIWDTEEAAKERIDGLNKGRSRFMSKAWIVKHVVHSGKPEAPTRSGKVDAPSERRG